jgi:hypothetical protein
MFRSLRRWWPAVVVVAAVMAVVWFRIGDPVQQQWEERTTLPSCGAVDLHHGEELRRDAPAALACLRSALTSGEGAELVVTSPTTEGDPITAYYRVTPAGTTELYEDATEDAFGDGAWHFAECDRPEGVLDVAC